MENLTLAQLQERLNNLNAERDALEKRIAEVIKLEQDSVVAQIRSLMSEYKIDPTAIAGGVKKARKPHVKSGPVEAKYRGANGETWSGRGRQPRWMSDDREKFLIKD